MTARSEGLRDLHVSLGDGSVNRLVASSLIVLMSLIWLVFLIGRSDAVAVGAANSHEVGDPLARSGPEAVGANPQTVRQQVASPGVQIEVQDSSSRAISGVEVYVGGVGRRWMDVATVRARARTGEDGRCSIEGSVVTPPNSSRMVLQKAGYVTAVIEATQPGEQYLVRLESAVRAELRFVDQGGNAVAGIRAWLSQSASPSNCIGIASEVMCITGDGGDRAVHASISDSRGVAAFESLEPGEYVLMVDPGMWAITRGSPHQKLEITNGGVVLDFTLASPWACFATVTGDSILRHKVVLPKGAALSNSLTGQSLDYLTRRLRSTYPDSIVDLFVLNSGASPDVELELIAGKKGRLRVPLKLVQVDSLRDAVAVDLSGYPDVVTSALVLPRIVCPDGTALDGLPMLLRSKDGAIAMTTTSGKSLLLPPGSYEVRSFEPVLFKVAPVGTSFEVNSATQSSGPLHVDLKATIQLVVFEIEIVGSGENIPAECRVVIDSQCGESAFVLRSHVRLKTVVQPGPVKVSIQAVGVPTHVIEKTVESKAGGEVERLVVDLGT